MAIEPLIWVRPEKPTFDLAGVVLGALSLAGLCALLALILGIAYGLTMIRRRRRHPPLLAGLQLLPAPRP